MTTAPRHPRLAIHTRTHRDWTLAECCARYAAAGAGGVAVWRELIDPAEGGVTTADAARIIADHGLRVPALVRGGFLVSSRAARRAAALDDTRRALDDAAALGAEQLVIVAGAEPGLPHADARGQLAEGLATLAPPARDAGVRLALEPLHPVYAADRSCVCSLRVANDVCDAVDHPALGVVVDVYHVWWEDDLAREIERCGAAGRLAGFHVCDWRVVTRHPLNDRGLMGDGCIDVRGIRRAVEAAGFGGMHEVEVFSDDYRAMDPQAYLDLIVRRYEDHVLDPV